MFGQAWWREQGAFEWRTACQRARSPSARGTLGRRIVDIVDEGFDVAVEDIHSGRLEAVMLDFKPVGLDLCRRSLKEASFRQVMLLGVLLTYGLQALQRRLMPWQR